MIQIEDEDEKLYLKTIAGDDYIQDQLNFEKFPLRADNNNNQESINTNPFSGKSSLNLPDITIPIEERHNPIGPFKKGRHSSKSSKSLSPNTIMYMNRDLKMKLSKNTRNDIVVNREVTEVTEKRSIQRQSVKIINFGQEIENIHAD